MKKTERWEKLLSREGVDFLTVSVIDTVFYDAIWAMTKSKKELFFTRMHQKNFTHYIGVSGKELGKYCFNKYFNTQDKIIDLFNDGEKLLKNTDKATRAWKEKLKNDNSNKSLCNAFADFKKDFVKVNYFYSILPWPAVEFWQTEFEKNISGLIADRKLKDKQEIIILSAYKPWKETAILKLQKEIEQNKDVKMLAEKYQFLRSWSAVWYRPIDESWIKSLSPKIQQEKQKLYSQKELIRILKPNREEKKYLELSPYIIFFKDYRDDLRRKQVYLWSFLFDAIAKKYKVDHQDLGYLSIDELEECLKQDELAYKTIEHRKENLCIITSVGEVLKMKVIDKDVPKKYLEIIDLIEDRVKDVLIKGLIAQKGKISGRVRIVKSFHDIKKVIEGEILVANTTHPNYLPAMQKAAGFVTNEGGIISHAAIVARELKKPCVVGTKTATKILKDGDLVEVDADKGIIRIINNKK